ncbi:ABC transporter-related protein [Pyrolobus fumarii 1A]|uniref:ABC transporter-related protein n=1 Tax=Pyrolobus fumarii (strain DSM 11204 / 1A) TaxID=694429 RepID=G0ECV4_PYRF1|nr:ABC transporter ATP-binding protein [Pyrolobus fumarii]AEM39674.1 ABC transporter-related protein [Pyrolobus fumarii 1A]
MPVVEARGLVKRFGGVTALDHVTLTFDEGMVYAIIGPNGSGKTTLLNVLTGYVKPDAGSVHIMGKDVTKWPPHRIASLGVGRVFQIPLPFRTLTVYDNVAIANPSLSGSEVMELLRLVGLEGKAWERAGRLSGGQQKLLEIARALAKNPKILYMDEPTAGVNPGLFERIENAIREMKERGTTVVIIEHNVRFVSRIADEMIAMAQGRVIARGAPEEVTRDPRVIESYLGSEVP